ncbi:MAG: chromate transporter [Planctomycetes bacterium]|nr:chromate transporter [Planctomycetota bacterium]
MTPTDKTTIDNEKLKEQAERLYLQGLHAFAGSANTSDVESMKRAAGLWQQSWKLYLKAGDTERAKDLKKSLAVLYKKEYVKANKNKKTHVSLAGKFKDWVMFFKIGCFGFGGPMAVFTLLEDELVRKKKILTNQDFLEGAVLGDVLPGPVTMDIVTYTGYKLKKWTGALIATLVFILPSFVLMIFLAMAYDKYSLTPKIAGVLQCLGAAVTGLILSVAMKLTKAEMKDYRELCILIWAFASSLIFKVDIVVIVGLCGLVGIVVYSNEPEERNK